MANPNPSRARREKAKKRLAAVTSGDLKQAQAALWLVIEDGVNRLEEIDASDTNGFGRIASAITSATREYREIIGATELEARISEIEKRQTNTGWSARA